MVINMDDNKKEKVVATILVSLVLLIFTINIVNHFLNKDKTDTSIILLENRNRFFEVSNCVDKFIKYVTIKDKDSILKIFNSDYLKSNSITENNVLNYVPNIGGNYFFSATMIYEQQLSKSIYKYYVKGNYMLDSLNNSFVKNEYYIIVYLYTDSMTFSVEPYDGDLFKG